MALIIERLEGELQVAQQQLDSSNAIITAYQVQLTRCRQLYSTYDALIQQKNTLIQLSDKELAQVKKDCKRLQRRLKATGIALPIAGAGIGAGIVALILTLKK